MAEVAAFMDTSRCEMFAHFMYDTHLTYHDLLKLETRFMGTVQGLLRSQDADHINFTPMGDGLMVQCVFGDYAPERFRTLCQAISAYMPPTLSGRILFVDKTLDILHIFHLSHASWREHALRIADVPGASVQK